MYTATHSKKITGLSREQVWQVWSDVNQWHAWQDDIEYAKLNGDFMMGNHFELKPKGGPKFKIKLIEVKPNHLFTDVTKFFLAKMLDKHEIIECGDELEIKTTICLTGMLSYLWQKLVVEKIAIGLEEQTQKLIDQIIKINKEK